jgi:esterase/lipase superfamily enzyme
MANWKMTVVAGRDVIGSRRHGRVQGRQDMALTGCSFGGYHAANLVLRRVDLFPVALCMSGVFDLARLGWGERGDTLYFHNPMDYVATGGGHLDWIRSRVLLQLVCGQGPWEDESASGSLPSPQRFAHLLADKGVPIPFTCGVTTARTTGRGWPSRSPTTCPASSEWVRVPPHEREARPGPPLPHRPCQNTHRH